MICPMPRDRGRGLIGEPVDGIANGNLPIIEHISKSAASPIGVHGLLQTWPCLFHAFAGFGFPQDLNATAANTQNPHTALRQTDTAEKQIGAAGRRRESGADLGHECLPDFLFHEGDLASAALIRVCFDTDMGHERGACHGTYGTASIAFDPDGCESAFGLHEVSLV
jgi:hypothetical protein